MLVSQWSHIHVYILWLNVCVYVTLAVKINWKSVFSNDHLKIIT